MVFSSIPFVIFFALLIIVETIIKRCFYRKPNYNRINHIVLLLFSMFFYGYWDVRFLALMFAIIFITYLTSFKINKRNLLLGTVVPLITLFIFKYFNFFISSFATAFSVQSISTLNLILPVGISFYTFQCLSYTIDVQKRKIEPQKDFIKLALYISFFPQLVAGPIVKASYFMPQLEQKRSISFIGFKIGLQIFLFGLFKKVVLADNISVFVDDVFYAPTLFSSGTLILAAVAYSLQIYFDFSGYSDMAIGCARCLGFKLPRNFNVPYLSQNISEFWKRWHISLSSWLQEYLYIPLGGNRKGPRRTYINLFLTMAIAGLWHGANWTFILWGSLHGLCLIIHKFSKQRLNFKIPKIITISTTYFIVTTLWILFRSETITHAITFYKSIFSNKIGVTVVHSWVIIGIFISTICFAFAIVNSSQHKVNIQGYYLISNLKSFRPCLVLNVAIGLILGLAFTGTNPFIYFQF